MSVGQGNYDAEEASRRNYTAPYSSHHPVPTVQKYNEHRDELETRKEQQEKTYDEDDEGKVHEAVDKVKRMFQGGANKHRAGDPYPTENRNDESTAPRDGDKDDSKPAPPAKDNSSKGNGQNNDPKKNGQSGPSATEVNAGITDPRQKRKNMKHMKRDDGGREVTDPITHLPVVIYDSTDKRLEKAPQNEPAYGSQPRTATGLSGASKSKSQLNLETQEEQDEHRGMEKVFPPPNFEDAQVELKRAYQFALTVGLGSIVTFATFVLVVWQLLSLKSKESASYVRLFLPVLATIILSAGIGSAIIFSIRGWLGKKVEGIWQDEIWDAARSQEKEEIKNSPLPESTQWLNRFLASVWPLINPDLFTSLADMLEDVMQASLPKMVRMIIVDDLGQGSESFRILGVKWLPTGAASQSVDIKGNLKDAKSQETSDRTAPGEGEIDNSEQSDEKDESSSGDKDEKAKQQQEQQSKQQEQETTAEGLEAEQGDFVNLEMALAYRARSSGRYLKAKAKNAHLYLKFYLPGGIVMPVWVELKGLILTMRMRLQLTPDPPFVALATITFLGQPRATLSCVPLSKHSLNIMDVPLISSFVQSSIDAALAEYVAPKSLTLDLKDMLMGDDFKKDTIARGVIVAYIKSARDFKEGDSSIGPFKEGSSDGYVTTSWAKFAKPQAATRIIISDMHPTWNEWSYLIVTPQELNAQEKLRLQLWDSDRTNADDDLGRVEVDLKELMDSERTKGKMYDREDRLMGENLDEKMPGTLKWSVGYFAKTGITEEQLAQQSADPDIKNKEDLTKKVAETAERKLREATKHNESGELDQQKAQDYKERENSLIISSSPSGDYPSGVLSIVVHNITGLELENLRKDRSKDDTGADKEDEAEVSDDLPSSYCTIILNHQKIYKTRTKPKNAKPFFNAGTEKFIRDWRTTEIMISVRDARVHENDPLLGIVYLPLGKLFHKRSQIMDSFPLVGGIGFGRARISMVFRSVELQAPKELLGWDYGTLEIKSPVKVEGSLPDEIRKLRIKLRTTISRAKMQAHNGEWIPKHDKKTVCLAVRKRYSSPLVIEFRKNSLGPDSTAAFAVLWLSEIPDEEDKTVALKVWKGGKENLKHATSCCEYAGLKDGEQALGEIELSMKLWRGLSGYHTSFSKKGKEQDLRDVMEVLDTANEEKEGTAYDEHGDSDSSDSEDEHHGHNGGPSSNKAEIKDLEKAHDSSDSEADGERPSGIKGNLKALVDGHNKSDDGKRGLMSQYKDYKDHRKQLDRKHRGIMQWKGPRTMDWIATKARHGKGHIADMVGHGEREPGLETEA